MSPNADQSQRSSVGVRQWRERTLVSAGFDDALAARLTGEPDVDLHHCSNWSTAAVPRTSPLAPLATAAP